MPIESSERGGRTRADWRSRFSEANAEVATAREDLDEALDRLAEVVGKTSNWKVAAPGAGQGNPNDNSPTNYGLKQEVRGKREDLERAERQLRGLSVEANLAGVPEDWYETSD
jgi:outer membrane protein TolC